MDSKYILNFLYDLKENNNRDWFNENKSRYEKAKKDFTEFINFMIVKISEFDNDVNGVTAKESLFRIYRDVRFSKNKDPYKTNFGAYISKDGRKSPYAGYYIHIEPQNSFYAGGLYCPQPKVLQSIRNNIYENANEFKQIINQKDFKNTFGELWGEKLKRGPKGFPNDFIDIDLLKYKSYVSLLQLNDDAVLSKKYPEILLNGLKKSYPLNRYFNHIITELK